MAGVLLVNPKFPHNVAQVLRICSCYGVTDLLYTGTRMDAALAQHSRLPREERMKGYADVNWRNSQRPFDEMADMVPVAVEVRPNCEMLQDFIHPVNALYVFGPEDGSLGHVALRHCHHFVAIPTRHCLNLSMAVGTVLYDRLTKLDPDARMDMKMTEGRGWADDENYA